MIQTTCLSATNLINFVYYSEPKSTPTHTDRTNKVEKKYGGNILKGSVNNRESTLLFSSFGFGSGISWLKKLSNFNWAAEYRLWETLKCLGILNSLRSVLSICCCGFYILLQFLWYGQVDELTKLLFFSISMIMVRSKTSSKDTFGHFLFCHIWSNWSWMLKCSTQNVVALSTQDSLSAW